MGAVGELLLAVASHLGVLVVEVVVFNGGAQLVGELIAYSEGEQGGHIVACTGAILVGSDLVAKLCQRCSPRDVRHGGCSRWVCILDGCIKGLGIILRINLGAELVAGCHGERSLVVVERDDGGEAPALLQTVELQVEQLHVAQLRIGGGCDVATVVAIVVVGTQTYGSGEVVGEFVREVQLAAKDILLTLHL